MWVGEREDMCSSLALPPTHYIPNHLHTFSTVASHFWVPQFLSVQLEIFTLSHFETQTLRHQKSVASWKFWTKSLCASISLLGIYIPYGWIWCSNLDFVYRTKVNLPFMFLIWAWNVVSIISFVKRLHCFKIKIQGWRTSGQFWKYLFSMVITALIS